MEMTLNTRITPHPDVVWRLVEGEVVLLSVTSGEYYGLDAIGSRVWSLIPAEGVTLGGLCTALATEFDAPAEAIDRDVRALCDRLIAADLLVAA